MVRTLTSMARMDERFDAFERSKSGHAACERICLLDSCIFLNCQRSQSREHLHRSHKQSFACCTSTMPRPAKPHNEIPGSSSTLVQHSIYILVPLTRSKKAVRVLREVSLECLKTPGYDPLRPKRHDPTPFVKEGLERLGHTVSFQKYWIRIQITSSKD